MMYLSVSGDQAKRAQAIKQFYSLGEADWQDDYPQVNPKSMTTLSTALKSTWTIDQTKKHLLACFPGTPLKSSNQKLQQLQQDALFQATLSQKKQSMIRRNKILMFN